MKIEINFSGWTAWWNRPETRSRAYRISRFLTIALVVLAAASVVMLAALYWPMLTGARSIPLLALLDEFDDELEVIALMICGAVVCAVLTRFLRRKSKEAAEAPEAGPPAE